ncbi:MAG TPA: type II toxin-antitoxin system VapC family toxin [Candidatus Angelobacter sp.]|nr:type II toxin-antitoxin system VapC family toxin [Candidatus Angelobacter sp.]
MRYLLDTTVFVWSLKEPEKLNQQAFAILEDDAQEVFLSAVSSWEIVIKSAIGKLALPKAPALFIVEVMSRFSIQPLSITHAHTLAVAELEQYHRDPFDRLLIAQARSEKMVLMTVDSFIDKYRVETFWCGK